MTSRGSLRWINGLAVAAAVLFAVGLAAVLVLDRIGVPERLVRAIAPMMTLVGLALFGLGARNADLASFLAARRNAPPFYGGLGLTAVLAGMALCLDTGLWPLPDPLAPAMAAGAAIGAIGIGPLLRRFGATVAERRRRHPLSGLAGGGRLGDCGLGDRGPDRARRLRGRRRRDRDIGHAEPGGGGDHRVGGGLPQRRAWRSGRRHLVLGRERRRTRHDRRLGLGVGMGARRLAFGSLPLPAPPPFDSRPAVVACRRGSRGRRFLRPAVAGVRQPGRGLGGPRRDSRVGHLRGAGRRGVCCASFLSGRRSARVPLSVARSLLGAATLASTLALAGVGVHASSRAFGVALTQIRRPFPTPASVRLARMRAAQAALVMGCAICDSRGVLGSRTALIVALALSLGLTTPMIALAAIGRVGPLSASVAALAALAVGVSARGRDGARRPERRRCSKPPSWPPPRRLSWARWLPFSRRAARRLRRPLVRSFRRRLREQKQTSRLVVDSPIAGRQNPPALARVLAVPGRDDAARPFDNRRKGDDVVRL